MLGGNPHHDRFGFRNFKDPVLIKEFVSEGSTGQFLAIWAALIYGTYTSTRNITNVDRFVGTFAIGGPEIMNTMLGELQNPRRNFPRISRQIYLVS